MSEVVRSHISNQEPLEIAIKLISYYYLEIHQKEAKPTQLTLTMKSKSIIGITQRRCGKRIVGQACKLMVAHFEFSHIL
jgi:hypothetical protein